MENRIKINLLGIKLSFINFLSKRNNYIFLNRLGKSKKQRCIKGLCVKYYGTDSTVEFKDEIPKMKNVVIHLGSNSKVVFGKSDYSIKNLFINMRADNTTLIVGENFSVESGKIDLHGEPNIKIEIGNDCQFGCNVEIDPADGHTIYDDETKQVLNTPADIKIGNHVWLCKDVSVLKGALISDNTVVGKGSIVTSRFDKSNVILAGIPAKIVQSEKYKKVNWSRQANKSFGKYTQ